MMIAAHLVWGSATGLLYEAARSGSSRQAPPRSSEPPEAGGSGV